LKIRVTRAAALAAIALAALAAVPAAAQEEPWRPGTSWATARIGTARVFGEDSPGGNVGWGVAYRRMMSPKVSIAAAADHDLLGRFGSASLIQVPFSLEFATHLRWKTGLRPAIGLGFAAVYRKAYRSGDDHSEFQPAGFLSMALHAPISAQALLGLEFQLMSVSGDLSGTNPTFGGYSSSNGIGTFKVSLSRAFY
jgi:hypothetical protein